MPALIFDLSEVLIRGLLGVEEKLASYSTLPPRDILRCMGGKILEAVCLGRISEETYLDEVIQLAGLSLSPDNLKTLIRANFRKEIEGMPALIRELSKGHELFLLSDHAPEWVNFILQTHPFLQVFKARFFSFELGFTKKDPLSFLSVLQTQKLSAAECLFIDDSPGNISCAAQIGLWGINFLNRTQLENDLENLLYKGKR